MAALEQITLDATTPRVPFNARGGRSGRLTKLQVQLVAVVGGGALQFRRRLSGSGVADADAPLCCYEDVCALAEDGGTVRFADEPATALRLYEIPNDNSDIIVELASGTSATIVVANLVESAG